MLRGVRSRSAVCAASSAPRGAATLVHAPVRARSAVSVLRVPSRCYSTEKPSAVIQPASTYRIKAPERPISPHVSIYRFPLPAIASITNRATGVALFVGAAGVAGASLVDPLGAFHAVEALKTGAPGLVPVAKALVAFPVVYHYLAGLRHLYWDSSAKGLDLETVNRGSTILIALAVLLTIALSFIQI